MCIKHAPSIFHKQSLNAVARHLNRSAKHKSLNRFLEGFQEGRWYAKGKPAKQSLFLDGVERKAKVFPDNAVRNPQKIVPDDFFFARHKEANIIFISKLLIIDSVENIHTSKNKTFIQSA